MIWPNKIEIGEKIYNEMGIFESIYGIEYGFGNEKYISTIDIFDRKFEKLRTYRLDKHGAKLVMEIKRATLKNLEKVTLDYIENDFGLNALASQLN